MLMDTVEGKIEAEEEGRLAVTSSFKRTLRPDHADTTVDNSGVPGT